MRRELNAYDANQMDRIINHNDGVIGCIKMDPSKSNQELLEEFIDTQIEFLGDDYLFELNDVYYDIDTKIENNLLIRLKHDVFDEIKLFLKMLKQ